MNNPIYELNRNTQFDDEIPCLCSEEESGEKWNWDNLEMIIFVCYVLLIMEKIVIPILEETASPPLNTPPKHGQFVNILHMIFISIEACLA